MVFWLLMLFYVLMQSFYDFCIVYVQYMTESILAHLVYAFGLVLTLLLFPCLFQGARETTYI